MWAAARAAQRGLEGGTVSVLSDALRQSGVVAFAKANESSILSSPVRNARIPAAC